MDMDLTQKLTNFLVESILADDHITKVVAIYAGRFQPAALHHLKVFTWVQNKFGKDNSYIATTDKVSLPDSPLNFDEKQKIWARHGIDSSKVIKVKSPYKADEIVQKFDPKSTAVVYIFGDKDADRLKGGKKADGSPAYFQPYVPGEVLNNYIDHGYFISAPHVSLKVNGKELSGTAVRNLLGSAMSESAKKKLFEKIFDWYDDVIYTTIVPKFVDANKNVNETAVAKKKLNESLDESPDGVYANGQEIATPFQEEALTFLMDGNNVIYSFAEDQNHKDDEDRFYTHDELFYLLIDNEVLPSDIGVSCLGSFEKLRQSVVTFRQEHGNYAREFGVSGRIWLALYDDTKDDNGSYNICSFWTEKDVVLKNWKSVEKFLKQFGNINKFKFDFRDRSAKSSLIPLNQLTANHDTINKEDADDLMKKQHLDPKAKAQLGKNLAGSKKLATVSSKSKAGFKTPAEFNAKRSIDEGAGFGFIKHIDDLKPHEVLDFLKKWNQSLEEFIVNEKVDGHFYKFGIENGRFYTEDSKKRKYFETKEYPNVYFFNVFRKYHQLLSKVNFSAILRSIGAKDTKNFEVQSESVPRHDHNVIAYDKNVVGDGIVVVINMTIDGQRASDVDIKNFCININQQSSIKFYSTPILDFSKFKFEENIINKLQFVIKQYGDVLAKAARTSEEKANKEKAKGLIKQLATKAKNSMLTFDFVKSFGPDFEGLVIYMPDGNIVKMVDKEKFTSLKNTNWGIIEKIDDATKEFKNEVKRNPNNIESAVKTLKTQLRELEKEFDGKAKLSMMAGKIEDTEEHFKMVYNQISRIEELLKNKVSNADIADKVVNRTLNESGHAVAIRSDGKPKMFRDVDGEIKPAGVSSIDLKKIPRSDFLNQLKQMIETINNHTHAWGNIDFDNDFHKYFSGSTRIFSNNKDVPDEKFIKYKPSVGDIDIMIPKENEDKVKSFLQSKEYFPKNSDVDWEPNPKSKLSDKIYFVGYGKGVIDDISVFAYFHAKNDFVLFQIDFDGSDFTNVNGKMLPTDWASFSRSSAIGDVEHGIKGVFHKLFLITLTRLANDLGDIIIVKNYDNNKDKPDKWKYVTLPAAHLFLYYKLDGIRKRYELIPGKRLKGKPLYREITAKETREKGAYINNLSEIYKLLFGETPDTTGLGRMWSFVGLLEVLKTALESGKVDEAYIDRIFKEFVTIDLYDKGSKVVSKNLEEDKKLKHAVVSKFLAEFPYLHKFDDYLNQLIKNYYKQS